MPRKHCPQPGGAPPQQTPPLPSRPRPGCPGARCRFSSVPRPLAPHNSPEVPWSAPQSSVVTPGIPAPYSAPPSSLVPWSPRSPLSPGPAWHARQSRSGGSWPSTPAAPSACGVSAAVSQRRPQRGQPRGLGWDGVVWVLSRIPEAIGPTQAPHTESWPPTCLLLDRREENGTGPRWCGQRSARPGCVWLAAVRASTWNRGCGVARPPRACLPSSLAKQGGGQVFRGCEPPH